MFLNQSIIILLLQLSWKRITMRHSFSLQDVLISTKAEQGADNFDLEFNKSYIHNKPLHASKEKTSLATPSTWKKWLRASLMVLLGFCYYCRFFNLTSDATLDDVLQVACEFCGKTWEVATNSVVPQPFIEQYCCRAPYIVTLLRDGLHITNDQLLIGSGSITWTLGVAFLEAEQAFRRKSEFLGYSILHASTNPAVLLGLLLIAVLLLFCTISHAFRCTSKIS